MKDSLLVISLVINVIICIGIPLGVFIYILVKKRNYLKSYVIGALVFFITQICLRLPLINNVMVKFDSFNIFKSSTYCRNIFIIQSHNIVKFKFGQ